MNRQVVEFPFRTCFPIVIATIIALLSGSAQAAPFAESIEFRQPGGKLIKLWGEGDEFYAIFETLDGYSVTFDEARRGYCYARLSAKGDRLESTGELVLAGHTPAGVTPHLRIKPEAIRAQVAARRLLLDPNNEQERRWRELKDKHLENMRPTIAADGSPSGPLSAPPSAPTTGNKLGLCLLIDFDDDPASIAQSEINSYCNAVSYSGYGNNGSVRKYFQDVSNGSLNYSNVVTIYVRIPNSLHAKSWYNDTTKDNGSQGNLLVRDALTILKARSDYNSTILPLFNNLTVDEANQVLACNVFYAGGNGGVWSKGLWPHSWALNNVGAQELTPGGKKVFRYQITNIGTSLTIATFCHENGHMLCGFPDLYDYDGDSEGGAGIFCLMGSGGHGGNPSQVCAYLKYKAGWCTVTELDSTSYLTATVAASGTGLNALYRYAKPGTATEYFLAENRQIAGRDAILPAGGVAIWHIDELGDRDNQSLTPNTTHANYECTLVQADNQWHFQYNLNSGDAQDLYRSGNPAAGYGNRIDDTTAPHAHWWSGASSALHWENFSASGTTMTFDVRGTGGGSQPIIQAPPASQTAAEGGTVTFDVSAAGTAPLLYRWRKDGGLLSDGVRISGATTSHLLISNVQLLDAGSYVAVVTNTFGSVTSTPAAALSILTAPQITSQPQNVIATLGNAAAFSVGATGAAPLRYQWRKNGTPIGNATNSGYTITLVTTDDTASYSVVVSNRYNTVTSADATLSIATNITLAAALDTPGRTWTTSGNNFWKGQADITHDGMDAADSGPVSDGEYVAMETLVTGPAWLRFYWKVSSEENFDFLELWMDGNYRGGISGEQDWTYAEYFVPAGVHTMQWTYVKDGSVTRGVDRGWVDQVTIETGAVLTLAQALDDPNLTWTTGSFGGAEPWYAVIWNSADNEDAAESGYFMPDNSGSWISTTVTGPGTLYFKWSVSSEANYDGLVFYINNVMQEYISGLVDWTPVVYHLSAGTQTLGWQYEKDGAGVGNYDGGWLDMVEFVPDTPRITQHPTSQTAEAGSTVTFTAAGTGASPLYFSWRKGGVPISGATQEVLLLQNVQAADAATYTFVVNNGLSTAVSAAAILTIQPVITLGEAVDAPTLTWTTGGSNYWYGSRNGSHDGTDTARSTPIGNQESCWIHTSITGPGEVSFWWRVSSETNYDFAKFLVSTNIRASVSGESGWRQVIVPIPPGPQGLTWTYEKDQSVTEGLDMMWVDQFGFVPDSSAISSIACNNGTALLAIASVVGRSYWLEYKNSLSDPSWIPVLPSAPGNGATLVLTNTITGVPHRFYRVVSQ